MPDKDTARGVVLAHAARILAVAPARLLAQPKLDTYPAFSSFRMVDLVEELEQSLGITFDEADLTLENLRHLDRLTAVTSRAADSAATRVA
ncbi:hypothetical protein ABZ154_31195 [Streptomyces sp. NPDC006261]|uniref:hypothetical protein n=1 Tax=Streptomyces sp. NPDC006261 TaxID=3156739 RepID=UPI0033B5B5FF